MVRIEFRTFDDDEGYVLARVDWPQVPRVGESIEFDALLTKVDRDRMRKGEIDELHADYHCLVFEVEWVRWRLEILAGEQGGEPEVMVWLRLPAEDCAWEGAKR